MGEVREKCGVVGVFDPEEATELAAKAIRVLDHRGPHATGLGGISDENNIEVFVAPGRAREVLTDQEVSRLGDLSLTAALAHSRYATSGGIETAHPIRVNEGRETILYAENGNASDLRSLERDLAVRGHNTTRLNDSEMKALAIGDRVKRGASLVEAIADAYEHFIGGYSAVVVGYNPDGDPTLAAFRDPCGIRPLVWGKTKSGGYMFASETIGLEKAGATFEGEVPPGGLMTVNRKGVEWYQLAPPNPKFDPFEIIYFSNKNSLFKGKRIGDIRAALGRCLAEEYGYDPAADAVVGVPNSAITYATGYAAATGIAHRQEILRKHKDTRTFLGDSAAERAQLRDTVYDMQDDLAGGRFEVIDDSIFRNTTAPYVARLFEKANGRIGRMLIGSPPIRYPNFYGINTPDQHDLVASYMSMSELRDEIGVDSLGFLSLEGMLRTFSATTGAPADHFDLSCFTGDYSHTPIGPRRIYVPAHAGYHA